MPSEPLPPVHPVPASPSPTPSSSSGWSGRRVLVTGGSGFLGRHVVAALAGAGAVVYATVRTAPRRTPVHATRLLPLDLRDPAAIDSAVRAVQPDVLLHLGGRVSGAVDPAMVTPTFETLLTSGLAFLAAAQRGDVGRLLLCGSADEAHPGQTPASPYSAAKSSLASYARLYASAFDTPVVYVRPTHTFGPGQAPEKLLPHVAAAAVRGERPRLSNGRRRGDWVYVDDVVDGMLTAALDAPAGAEVDLGTGTLRSSREVVERLLRVIGTDVEPEWGAVPDRPDEQERPADVAHTAAVLGWRARMPLDDGLARLAAAVRAEVRDPALARS